MFRLISAVLLIAGTAAIPTSIAAAAPVAKDENLAAIIVADHNEVRVAAGLEPLSLFEPASHYTEANSVAMANGGAIVHTNLNDVMDEFQTAMWAGENTAVMYEPASQATQIWLDSPAHARVLMTPYATHINVSVRCSSDGRLWATVLLIEDTTAAKVTPPAPTATSGANARCARPFEPFRSSPDFVAQQYRDLLGREPEQAGIDYWVVEIENDRVAPTQLIAAFMNSEEFAGRIAPIIKLHLAGTGRLPSADQLRASIAKIEAGMSLAELGDQILTSAAGQASFGNLNGAEFVDDLHRRLLARPASNAELAHWSAGFGRGEVLAGVAGDAEYHHNTYATVQVYMSYVGMLNRTPDAGGLVYWTGVINDGGSLDALLHGFISSTEYRNRF